jgi:hypothetical protein
MSSRSFPKSADRREGAIFTGQRKAITRIEEGENHTYMIKKEAWNKTIGSCYEQSENQGIFEPIF